MTYSWQGVATAAGADPRAQDVTITSDDRRRLHQIADELIPEGAGMPAASAVGVAAEQLDLVLRSRPDLAEPLRRALAQHAEGDVNAWMARLEGEDPDAHRALTTTVLAAYYLSAQVRERLGYPGQQASQVSSAFPEYVTEGLLDPVIERGPRFRDPDA